MTRNASKIELGPAISEQITAIKSHNQGEIQEVKVGRHSYGIATVLS
jgi:hypothetical protein